MKRTFQQRYNKSEHKVVAIDLDGTIWSENFPNFGKVFPYAIETINAMVDYGYEVILWTCRANENLEACKKELTRLGLNDKILVNEHAEYYLSKYSDQSPKVAASVYIDNSSYNAPTYDNYWHILANEFLDDVHLSKI